MVLLQPKLNLRVSQKQILTPGLVQMVSVLALNKLELKDMITAELVENPVLEELESSVPLLDDVAGREADRDRAKAEAAVAEPEQKDPFEEVDFGQFFNEYLDPGYRTAGGMGMGLEDLDKPSFENFLSRPGTLTDHLMWQLGALNMRPPVREAAELVIGNLNEDGYLIASEDELLGIAEPEAAAVEETPAVAPEAVAIFGTEDGAGELAAELAEEEDHGPLPEGILPPGSRVGGAPLASADVAEAPKPEPVKPKLELVPENGQGYKPAATFTREDLRDAIQMVQQMDPVGVAARDLRECLLAQLKYQKQLAKKQNGAADPNVVQAIADATAIVAEHLKALQNKNYKEIARAMNRPLEAVMAAFEYIRTLDPRPGLRYNRIEPRLIEPDVAFVKQGDEYLIVMNDDDLPQLRLNPAYRRLLNKDAAEKDVRTYVKERYKSAIQLIKNIEQRKHTILKVCQAIIGRQRDFLEHGLEHLKPMMIKEVAEEVGVHPSTVSRAVANKYVHTPQGVFELRYFFSESVQGPEGGNTPLLLLKRKVKKLIEEEDPTRPLTDEQITRILQSQGIQVTRRTVAKYREDMKIPSTHQRRTKN